MSASNEFINYVTELLAPIGTFDGGRFFGGYGLKHQGIQFAMIMGNTLYFVVDDTTRPRYEQLNRQPFSYMTKNGERLVKRYYEVPESLFEEQDELLVWARESIDIARRSSKKTAR